MRVRVDDELHASIARQPGVNVVEIQAIDLAVDLKRDAGRGRGGEHPVDIEAVGLAFEDQPSGRVRQDIHPRAGHRAQQPVGHLRRVLVERRVNRGDDDIELGEAVVGEIHRAVGRGCRTRCPRAR